MTAYYIEAVDGEKIGGKDWLYIHEPDGTMHFLFNRDAGQVRFPIEKFVEVLCADVQGCEVA